MIRKILFILLLSVKITQAQKTPQKVYTYFFKFSTPILQTEHEVLVFFYNNEYLDNQRSLLKIKADTVYKITSTQPHKSFSYGDSHTLGTYSYIIHPDDTILIGYKDNLPFFKSTGNDIFIKISEVIHQKAGDIELSERQTVNYRRAPSYLRLITTNLNNKIRTLDSLNKEGHFTNKDYQVFYSQIYSLYCLDMLRPFYGKIKLNIDSLSSDYRDSLKSVKSFINNKETDQTSSMFKLIAWNYFKYYLMNGQYNHGFDNGLNIIKKNYTSTLQDFITFKYIKDNYLTLRTSEKQAVFEYIVNTPTVEYANYLRAEENKYKNVLQDSIGSVVLHTSDNKTTTLKSLAVENPGKLLYIDFWASWCIPCIGEIPYALKHIQKEDSLLMKMKYVFISIDKNKKNWLSAVEKYKLSSIQSNYIVDANSEALLKKELSLNTIPRYVIISRTGLIVGYDAFRPSDKDFTQKIGNYN